MAKKRETKIEPLGQLVKPQGIEKPSKNTGEEIRATFIVDSLKLQKLKDFAHLERRLIKDVIDQAITEFLENHYDDNEAAIESMTTGQLELLASKLGLSSTEVINKLKNNQVDQ
jgi:hypothetical protein